jgi:hypothetical protein
LCCAGEDDEQEQRPEDEAACAVLAGLDSEEREDRGQDRDPAQVGEEDALDQGTRTAVID